MRRTLRTAVAAFALLLPAALASAATPDGAKEEAPKTAPAKPEKKVASHKKDATKEAKDKAAPAPATPAK